MHSQNVEEVVWIERSMEAFISNTILREVSGLSQFKAICRQTAKFSAPLSLRIRE